jgi:hypothetical protein
MLSSTMSTGVLLLFQRRTPISFLKPVSNTLSCICQDAPFAVDTFPNTGCIAFFRYQDPLSFDLMWKSANEPIIQIQNGYSSISRRNPYDKAE